MGGGDESIVDAVCREIVVASGDVINIDSDDDEDPAGPPIRKWMLCRCASGSCRQSRIPVMFLYLDIFVTFVWKAGASRPCEASARPQIILYKEIFVGRTPTTAKK